MKCKNCADTATKIVEVSGTGRKTGAIYDHVKIAVCDPCYKTAMKSLQPDEIVHKVIEV